MAVAVNRYPNNWWIILFQGVAVLLLGIMLLTAPELTVVSLVVFLGFYWLVDGILSLVRIFTKSTDIHWGWLLLRGILGVLAALLILKHPLVSAVLVPTVLVIVLGVEGVVIGAVGIIEAFKGGGWGAGLIAALSIIFGLLLIFNPLLAALGLPFVFGVVGLIGGIILIVVAWQQR